MDSQEAVVSKNVPGINLKKYLLARFAYFRTNAASKVSAFGVFLVCIFPRSD